jgi:hypothetical protein
LRGVVGGLQTVNSKTSKWEATPCCASCHY